MSHALVSSIAQLRQEVRQLRDAGATIGLVPTMGALHRGHATLIERARKECGGVIVSIFVNPLQFDRAEDFQDYPITLSADEEMCARLGVDLVFAPNAAEMYPTPPASTIDVGKIGDHLCGRFRPGHFRGVATVVMKLFQIAQPDRAYFGEKDAQQLAVIEQLVRDFNVPVEIVPVPTVREPDGLAMSSRNVRLTPHERMSATILYRALREAEQQIARGETVAEAVKRHAAAAFRENDEVRLEYLEIVDPRAMQPVERIAGPVVVAGAMWVGPVRLIDNIRCAPGRS